MDRLVGAGGAADADHPRQDARHFGGRVELALALAGVGGEVAHQVLVGVAHDVVAFGHISLEVEAGRVENGNEVREPVHHVFALAELIRVVEVRDIDHAFEVVRLGELADELVDLVADLLVPFQGHHVGKARSFRHVEQHVFPAAVLVGDVFDEEQYQHVVLVLRSVHAAAQLVTALPERAIQF